MKNCERQPKYKHLAAEENNEEEIDENPEYKMRSIAKPLLRDSVGERESGVRERVDQIN